jgi:Na+/melibiose symporter-like transporter
MDTRLTTDLSPLTASRQGMLPWYRLAGLSALAFAIGFVINTIEPAILGHRTLELAPEIKNTVLGLLTFAGVLVAMAWQPIIGGLSDRTHSRWGRRIPYFVGGVASIVAALILIAITPGLTGVLLSLLFLQVAWNTVQSPSQALIPDHVPLGQRGAAAGWKSALEILAFVAGRQVSARLVAEDRVLAAAVVASVVAIVCLLIVLRLAREPGGEGSLPRLDLRQTFAFDRRRNPAFVPWFVNRALVWGGFIALSTFLLFFVIDVLGMGEAQAQRFVGNVSALMGLALLLVAVPAGWLADRVGRRRLVAASGLLAAAGTGILIASPTTTTALAAGAILGLSVGVFLTTSWALATQIVPGVEAARMLGLANIATAAGSGLARLGGGLIIDPFNRLTGSTAGGYMLLFALAGVAFLAGTAAILRLPPDEPTASRG